MRLEDILQEKWSDKYKKSINCSNPKGFSQKAHCAGKKKNENIVTPITKKDAALSKQAKHLKMKSMFAPGPVNQTVGANDAFLNNMSQTAKDANTLSKAAGIDTNFTKNTVANALRNTPSNTRLTSKFGRNKNEATNQYVLTPHQNLPNTKSTVGGTTMVTKAFKNLQKQQANTQAAVDARQGAGQSEIGFAKKVNKSDFSKNIFPNINKKPRIVTNSTNEAYDDVGQKIYKGNTTRIVHTPVADKNISIADKRIAKFSQQRDMDNLTYKGAKITTPGTNQTIAKAKSNINLAYNKQDKIDQRQGAGQSYITKGKPIKFESLDNVIKKAEIYVDMDGVLADFFGVWTKMIGVKNWKDVKDVDGALDKIRDTKDFWINLPLTPNASKLLNSIKKVKGNYNILSSPLPNDPNSEPQKREWVKKMLSGFAPKRVIITHNKSAYAKQPDGTPNILIDDYGDNISKWESAGGVGIQHSDKSADNTVKRLEEDAFNDLGRLINRTIRPGFYKKAAEKFHEWLRDQTRPYRHSLGYYAMEWSNKYRNMDWRNLRRAYLEMFGDEALVESKEPKLVKDKKQKNLKTMNKPTRYERRKNYVQADENIKKKDTKNEN